MWSELIEELDRWTAAGHVATFWWRDDDAEMPTSQLDTLLAVAGSHPISLAVVPGNRDLKPLANRLKSLDHITVLHHGWKHSNFTHAVRGEQGSSAAYAGTWQTPNATGTWSEYPEYRAFDEVVAEISAGRAALVNAFGQQALPGFVPPCHVISDRFLPILIANGITWISRLGPRRLWGLGLGILDMNAHVDLMDWTVRGLGDPHRKIKIMLNHLRARRAGQIDRREPTGIYTHHLAQDDKSWTFISQLLAITDTHKSAKWLHGREVFSTGKPGGLTLESIASEIPPLTMPVSWDRMVVT